MLSDFDKATKALELLESMNYKSGSVENAIKSVSGAILFLTKEEGESE